MNTELARPLRQDPVDLDVPVVDGTNRLERYANWIVGVAALVAAVVLLHVGRHSSFFLDEWWFVVRRRGSSIDDFFRPFNGHLVAVPVAVYKAMFAAFGLRSYLPYRVLLTGLHIGTCLLLFAYLRRRVTVVYALAAAIVILFLGVGWEDLLWPFQITFLLCMAGGVSALMLLDRRDRVGDVGAAVALGIALLSAGIGLVFAGGLLLELVWRRRDRRRIWVVLAPLALYLVWYVVRSSPSGKLDNFQYLEPFTTTLVGEAGRALTGMPVGVGQVLLVAFYALAILQTVRTWPVTGRFVSTLAMPVAFWAVVTYGRGAFPVGSRYAHVGAIFLVLAGAEVLRTFRPRALSRTTVVVGSIAIVALVAFALMVNIGALRDGADELQPFAVSDRARLSALVLAGDRVDRKAVAFGTNGELLVGPTLRALADLDYPVLDRDALRSLPEYARRTADGTLWDALGSADAVPGGAAPRQPSRVVSGTVAVDGACATVTPEGSAARVVVASDAVQMLVEAGNAPVEVTARSIAHGFEPIRTWSIPPAVTVAPATSRDLVVRATGIRPWTLRLTSDSTFRMCSLR